MNLLELIKKRRTIRKFKNKEIPQKILKECIDAARMAPSARNLQPLEFIVVIEPKIREKIFQTLSWGGKISEKHLAENLRPKAYVIVLANGKINPDADIDAGLAIENLVLAAFVQNLGSCILGAVEKEKIKTLCKIPGDFEIKVVVALGYPAEKSVAEDSNEPTEYWRDSKNILHVPKIKLEKILHYDNF